MSGGTITPPLPPQSPTPPGQPVVPQQSPQAVLIEDRIHKTRRQVKGVDIIAGLLTLIVGTVTYLFAAALVDHWLVTGGLGFWWRLLLWAILIIAAVLYFVKSLWPALVLSINPVFAARTIEQCKPTLKNSLINFLLLRGRESDLAPVIYQALEQRAASDLREVQIETAVDRRPVLRLSYLLLAVVGVICLYLALSPKNALISAQRVLWPWTSLRAPTRVTIENVRPGNTTAYLGDFVTVSADVMGLDQGEPVLLHYSTADGEIFDQVIPMIEENGAYGRQAKLPPDSRGLQQDYSYSITAGDFKTATYAIETQIPPLITVDKVDYHYPPYTGIPDTTIQRQGDVRAIEGTQITIHATANQPIDRAEIDFSGAGVRGIRMNSEDRTAAGRFTLRMLPGDPTRGEHDFYQLHFSDKNHRENRRPIRYNIEVLRDLPPEVQIVEPQKDESSVASDGKLEIRVRAEDPDYGLRRVVLRAKFENQELKIPPLLDARPPEKPVSGEVQSKYEFEPKKFNLKPGDRVAYWAEAEDNKEPSPNVTATGEQWIVVVPPENPPAKSDQQPRRAQRPGEKSSNDASQEQKTGQQPNEKSQPGQSQGEQNQQQNSEQSKPGEKGKEQGKSGDKNEQGKKGDGNEKSEKGDEGKNGDKGGNGEKGGNSEKGEKSNEGMKGEKGEKSGGSEKSESRDQSKQDSQGGSQQSSPQRSQSASQGDSSQTGKSGEKSASPESGRNTQQSSGNQSGKAQEPIDPNANPGDAIQKILEHRQEEQQKGQQKTQPGEKQQNNPQQPGEKQSAGDEKSGGQQPGEKQAAGEKQTPDEKQQTGSKQGEKQPSGDTKQSGEKQQNNSQQSGDTKQSGGKQGEKQPSGDAKQSGEKQQNNSQQSGDKNQSDGKQGEKQTSGDTNKSDGKQGERQQLGDANKSDGKQGDQQPSTEKQSGDKNPSGDAQRSGSKQGDQQPSAEKQPDAKQGEKQPANEQKPGASDQLKNQQQTPGAGQGSEQPKPSPEAQGANQPREKQPGQQGQDQNNKPEEGQSPSISPKQSESKGDSSGDRSGGGQQGGGQQAQKPGPGTPGSQTPADQGGSKSNEPGPGETGNKPGDQTQSRDSTGSAAKQQAPQGSSGQKQPGDNGSGAEQKQSAGSSTGQEQQKPSDGGKADNQLGKSNSKSGSGNPGTGGQEGGQTDIGPQPESQPSVADEANLNYARKQTELALEHLEDQLAKDKPDLLERLGWTREQAQRFIDRWQQLRQSAEEKSPRGEAAKKQLDDALKSFGLRPGTTYLKHGGTKADQIQDLHDSGRFAPPPDWAEQFREYTRGVANQGKAAEDKEQGTGN